MLFTSYLVRIADEKFVLASLEQYILVNISDDFQYEAADLPTLRWVVNLYSLYRSLAEKSYQIPYSQEAERILFHLVAQIEWDFPSFEIHPESLRWLFQQEKLSTTMSHQILKFCTNNSSNGYDTIAQGKCSRTVNDEVIAELVAAGDNYGAALFVSLLIQLVEGESEAHDILAVMNLMRTTINILPAASDQLCFHGIGNAIQYLLYSSIHSSTQFLTTVVFLLFDILRSAQPQILSDDQSWLSVTKKVIIFNSSILWYYHQSEH